MIDGDSLRRRLLYRDGQVLVVDKPAGVAVHAGPSGGPSLEAALDGLRFGLPRKPELAHRLDHDTSGCLVLGRHPRALKRLGRLFSEGRVAKTYWALVHGRPPDRRGRIELALAKRSTAQRGWWMEVDGEGRPALTDYAVKGEARGMSWLELRPRTGRTHQLRVHLAALGCPILGDPVYGAAEDPTPALQLHARAVTLPLYPAKPAIQVEAPAPAHMAEGLRACGLSRAA